MLNGQHILKFLSLLLMFFNCKNKRVQENIFGILFVSGEVIISKNCILNSQAKLIVNKNNCN